jgi:hypothetical protein
VLIYLLMTNSTASPPPTAAPGTINQADAIISKFTFTQSKGDKVQWQVDAQQARLFEQDKKAILDDVAVTLFVGDLHAERLHHLHQSLGLDGSDARDPHTGSRPHRR